MVDLILVAVFMGKVLFFIFLMFWVRATLPRMRVDRLMNFAWKYLVPLSIVNILIAAVWFEMVIRGQDGVTLVNWIKGTVVTGLLVVLPGLPCPVDQPEEYRGSAARVRLAHGRRPRARVAPRSAAPCDEGGEISLLTCSSRYRKTLTRFLASVDRRGIS